MSRLHHSLNARRAPIGAAREKEVHSMSPFYRPERPGVKNAAAGAVLPAAGTTEATMHIPCSNHPNNRCRAMRGDNAPWK